MFNLLQHLADALQGGPAQNIQRGAPAQPMAPMAGSRLQPAGGPRTLLGHLAQPPQAAALQVQPNHYAANLGVPTANQPQGYAMNGQPQMGNFNPGAIPLQAGSGFGPIQGGPDVRWQNVGQMMPTNMVNPQLNDNQQFWY